MRTPQLIPGSSQLNNLTSLSHYRFYKPLARLTFFSEFNIRFKTAPVTVVPKPQKTCLTLKTTVLLAYMRISKDNKLSAANAILSRK